MNLLKELSARANQLVEFFQGRIWRNRLPIAHHALRVDYLSRQHGARVHRERQDEHGFLTAINVHVRACRLVCQTTCGFLWRFVIQHTPENTRIPRSLNLVGLDVVSAGIIGVNLCPVGVGSTGAANGHDCQGHPDQGFTAKGRRNKGVIESSCQLVHVSTIK
jgi:hypothetical protein